MKYAINADVPAPNGPYAKGTTAGRLVFTSGQVALADDGNSLVGVNAAEQANRILDLCEKILSEVELELSDVAKVNVFLANMTDKDAVDDVIEDRFSLPAPAVTVVGVSELPMGALVEMDCVACR